MTVNEPARKLRRFFQTENLTERARYSRTTGCFYTKSRRCPACAVRRPPRLSARCDPAVHDSPRPRGVLSLESSGFRHNVNAHARDRWLAILNLLHTQAREYWNTFHELVHRIIEPAQPWLPFRRSRLETESSIESLVDSVAAELAFYPPPSFGHSCREWPKRPRFRLGQSAGFKKHTRRARVSSQRPTR